MALPVQGLSPAIAAILLAAPVSADQLAVRPGTATTGFVYHESYLQHDTGAGHIERPERLQAIVTRLENTGLMQRLVRINPSPAPLQSLTAIHTPEYVAEAQRACRAGRPYLHSPDTPISRLSYEAALLAAGGVLSAIDAVMAAKVRNAFCAVRPPGHHALRDRAMGFCLFNNVAIGARHVQRKHGLRKILIVDWDVHHGNATQDSFYDDPSIFYFSVHRYPFYPGSGAATESGAGTGAGSTLNAPLPGASGDEEYLRVFEDVLKPKAFAFAPDFVIISAGFDAHEDDPLGGMEVSTQGYAELTRVVKDIAEQSCSGRIVSVLEGGYHLDALAASVESHLLALLEND